MPNDVKAGSAYVEFGAKFGNLEKGLRQISARVGKLGSSIRNQGAKLTGLGAALSAPFVAATLQLSKYGDEVAKTARRTGQSTEFISGLGFAAELSGTSMGSLEKALRGMQRGLFDASRGQGEMIDALEVLGLSFDDIKDKSPEDLFYTISDSIKDVANPSTKAAVAMKVFGRAGAELIPLFDSGSDTLRGFIKDADELGVVLNGSVASEAEVVTDAMYRVQQSLKGVSLTIGAAVAPAVSLASDEITNLVKIGVAWAKENEKTIQIAAAVAFRISALGGAVLSLGFGLQGLSFAIGGVSKAMSLLSISSLKAFASMGLILGAVVIIGAGIAVATDAIMNFFDVGNLGVIDFISNIEIAGLSIGSWVEFGVANAILQLEKLKNVTAFIADSLVSAFESPLIAIKALFYSYVEAFAYPFTKLFSLIAEGLSVVGGDVGAASQKVAEVIGTFQSSISSSAGGARNDFSDSNKASEDRYLAAQKKVNDRERELSRLISGRLAEQKGKESTQDKVRSTFNELSGKVSEFIGGKFQALDTQFSELVKRKASPLEAPVFSGGGDDVPDVAAKTDGISQAKDSIVGTFSGRAAASFFGGGLNGMQKEQQKTNNILTSIDRSLSGNKNLVVG